MSTNVLLIVTLAIMAAAIVLTIRVGSTLNQKGDSDNAQYSANQGRKLGRLLSLYAVVILAVLIIFITMMKN